MTDHPPTEISALKRAKRAPSPKFRTGRLRLGLGTVLGALGLAVVVACGSPSAPVASPDIRVISPSDAATVQADPPPGLQIIDVRTPEEFADGHLAGATMIDFYEPDFAERIGDLDPDAPYLVYCRSGNRSGQTRMLMEELGFTDVRDVDGGIIAWGDADLPIAR